MRGAARRALPGVPGTRPVRGLGFSESAPGRAGAGVTGPPRMVSPGGRPTPFPVVAVAAWVLTLTVTGGGVVVAWVGSGAFRVACAVVVVAGAAASTRPCTVGPAPPESVPPNSRISTLVPPAMVASVARQPSVMERGKGVTSVTCPPPARYSVTVEPRRAVTAGMTRAPCTSMRRPLKVGVRE